MILVLAFIIFVCWAIKLDCKNPAYGQFQSPATGLSDQSVKGDHVDSTSEDFVFNDAFRITSAQAESIFITKNHVEKTISGTLWVHLDDTSAVLWTAINESTWYALGAAGDTLWAHLDDSTTVLWIALTDTSWMLRDAISDTTWAHLDDTSAVLWTAIHDTTWMVKGAIGDTLWAHLDESTAVLGTAMTETTWMALGAISDTIWAHLDESTAVLWVAVKDTAWMLRGVISDSMWQHLDDSTAVLWTAITDTSWMLRDAIHESLWTNTPGYITATLTEEEVEDIVGAMVTGNTEIGITVTYQDGDGTMDYEVSLGTDIDTLTEIVDAQFNQYVLNRAGGGGGANADSIKSIPIQDTTGNIGDVYGLTFDDSKDTLVWSEFWATPQTAPGNNNVLKVDTIPDPDTLYWAPAIIHKTAEIQTTDAAQTTLISHTLLDENTYHVEAQIVAVQSDGTDRASYHLACTVYRTGAGVATLQGSVTSLHTQESNVSLDATLTVSGSDIRVSVTGIVAETWEWGTTITYINISN